MQVQEPLPDTAAAVAEAQELKSPGLALCSCAVTCMCNNPGCTSLSGLSELASVSGRSCVCGGAVWPATVGARVNGQSGSSTSRCVRRLVRLLLVAQGRLMMQALQAAVELWGETPPPRSEIH
jgi:hypothetical protein